MSMMLLYNLLLQMGDSLPPEYERVDYLEGNGSEYINTGINGRTGLAAKYKMEFTFVSSTSIQQICAELGQNQQNRTYFPYMSNGNWYYAIGTSATAIQTNGIIADTVYNIEAIYKEDEQKIYINGVEVVSETNQVSFTTSVPLYLFASNNNVQKRIARAKIYSFEITDTTTGNKLANLIPCYRKSDNKPGMYDIVSGSFLTNIGTGEFNYPTT